MVPGVEVITPHGSIRRICVVGLPFGAVAGMTHNGTRTTWNPIAGTRPNLADPVTRNALLGNGEVQHVDDCEWVACCGHVYTGRAATRTEAICRAWIAAQKGKKS